MKRVFIFSLIFALLFLLTACLTEEPAPAFEGVTRMAACGLNLRDGTCTAVVLNTVDGPVGLLVEKGTPYEIPESEDTPAVTVLADGIAESRYHTGDTELRAEGCVMVERPGDLPLNTPVTLWYKPAKLTVLKQGRVTATG